MAGFALVDKPAGESSFASVQRVRRALGIGGRRGEKAGHAGTLDPFASGLLVVLLGTGTRLMPWVVGHDKRYLLTVRLGARSSTDDATGVIEPVGCPPPDESAIEAELAKLRWLEEQVPPAVSAIHVDGERAYRRVRRGEQLDLPARPVRYHRIELLEIDQAGTDMVDVRLDVRCASGTYMRALARDLGDRLGCGGHALELRRLEIGRWSVEDAVAPEAVTPRRIQPLAPIVAGQPQVQVDDRDALSFAYGQPVHGTAQQLSSPGSHDAVAVVSRGVLIGMAELDATGSSLRPRVVLVRPDDLERGGQGT